MAFYAHTENNGGRKELVADHLRETAALSRQFASVWGQGDEGKAVGLIHDLGKYTETFAKVLAREATNIDHATPGALALLKLYGNSGLAAALTVQGHHDGLQSGQPRELVSAVSMNEPISPLGKTFSARNVDALLVQFEKDGLFLPAKIRSDYPEDYANNRSIAAMLYARMLFSALVDADFLATEAHFSSDGSGYKYRPSGETLQPDKLLSVLLDYMKEVRQASNASKEIRSLRDDLFQASLTGGERPRGIYTLTAPTGAGKTLSMLAYALRHSLQHNLRRIIVVLPYLNIIEQNALVYHRVFASLTDKPLILEDHSVTELPEEQRLFAENWDAPIIITTTVRFFEGLFANRSSACRRLHNIANSVILFDEAQSIPPGLTVYTLAAMAQLVQRFGCSVVFSTATQPAFETFDGKVRKYSAIGWQPQELISPSLKLFQRTRKVKVRWQGHVPWDQVAMEVAAKPQALAIVNTRKQAKDLYQRISQQSRPGDVYHLSTDMCPAHRRSVITAVKKRLQGDEREKPQACRLISTQCVEAGVDLDFPTVWRALAPLEAICQAAGRCNREGLLPYGEVTVFRPPPEDEKYPDPSYQKGAVEVQMMLMEKTVDISDPEIIKEYYRRYFHNDLARFEDRELAEAIQAFDFQRTAQLYQWIPDNSINILVPFEPELQTYYELCQLARNGGFNRVWLQRARQLGVSYRANRHSDIWGLVEPVLDRYGETTGWYLLLDPQAYSPVTGLDVGKTNGAYFA